MSQRRNPNPPVLPGMKFLISEWNKVKDGLNDFNRVKFEEVAEQTKKDIQTSINNINDVIKEKTDGNEYKTVNDIKCFQGVIQTYEKLDSQINSMVEEEHKLFEQVDQFQSMDFPALPEEENFFNTFFNSAVTSHENNTEDDNPGYPGPHL